MSEINPWAEWEDRLDDTSLPPQAALWFAANGSEYERRVLAGNPVLPADSAEQLARDEDQLVLDSLASNHAVPTDVLVALAERGRVADEWIAYNFNAPMYLKRKLELRRMPARSLTLFLEQVRADDAEQSKVWGAVNSPTRSKLTLGAVWDAVRPVPRGDE
jgi:hypothetical protein